MGFQVISRRDTPSTGVLGARAFGVAQVCVQINSGAGQPTGVQSANTEPCTQGWVMDSFVQGLFTHRMGMAKRMGVVFPVCFFL